MALNLQPIPTEEISEVHPWREWFSSLRAVLLSIPAFSLTDGSGAALGTLTNSPTAGNPTKWISVNDNGTIRYIPTWE